MAETVEQALASERHAIVEAGTGVGKSLAYLIPAIYSRRRVIVSTANKALQDQLIGKDIPFLQHILPLDVGAALVKGRSNYLCLDRFDDEDRFQLVSGHQSEYRRLKSWAASTGTGDFEDTDVSLSGDLVRRVMSTTRTCIGSACQYFDAGCFVEKMRARAEAASVIVCNHALLLADLVVRDMGAYLLPDRDAVIIDEAHRLEDAAVSAFSVSLGHGDVLELAGSALLRRYAGEAAVAALAALADALFRPLEAAEIGPTDRSRGSSPSAARSPSTRTLTTQLAEGLLLAEALEAAVERLRRDNPFPSARPTKESKQYDKVVEWAAGLAEDVRLVSRVNDDDSVRYIERAAGARAGELRITWSPVDVSTLLAEILFRQTPVICTSATLAVGDFTYFKRAVGIGSAEELMAPSPFDYAEQCLLYVPSHLPTFGGAATPSYTAAISDEIARLVNASGGRAFLLFTSYRGMDDAYAALRERLPHTVLKQGEAPRAELLQRFRSDGAAVLFATKSFWEGIDVAGDALSLVVIDRMPFSVPDDPIVAARVARIKRDGGDWFDDLMLPAAVLQLKQGFGRLIRSRSDRGVVALLDSRIAQRAYGRRVIRSLPPARLTHNFDEVARFYRSL